MTLLYYIHTVGMLNHLYYFFKKEMARNKYPEETVNLILDVAQKLMLEKGYENTSIQDIINNLGGLSKGAVYHHFKSKEDIFYAVAERFNKEAVQEMKAIRDSKSYTGLEKLKRMFQVSLTQSDNDILYSTSPNMLDNPKLLSYQIQSIFNDVAPNYVRPILDEAIKDGSIKTNHPKEMAEVIILLTNLWLNPLIIETDVDEMENRVKFFNEILTKYGIELLDDQMLAAYKRYCTLSQFNK